MRQLRGSREMMGNPKPNSAAPVWAQLIVSPERAREIHEKLWPEDLMRGRPGLLYSPQPGETLKQRIPRRADEPTEIEVSDAWRVTHEFDGDEKSLTAI